ncbi:CD109 antigen-like [Anopheles darlingi]|uniref:CD109 antigen-like n=1 Tax=Anopheles darlingi TaxID=43151 RepID=UPI00210062C1|nr:CD109 antigen-like [Anopheles darlingi]
MSFLCRTAIFSFLTLISVSQAVLIVGPKSFRAKGDYTIVIHNFYKGANKVDLLLCLEGRDEDENVLWNITKSTDVRKNTNKLVSFKIPDHVPPGNYKLTIDGQNGFEFQSEAELIFLNQTIAALIQFSKPAYKPGDSVEFRVIVLDPDLKSPPEETMVNVTVKDSIGNIIGKWSDEPLSSGVFDGQMDLATSPLPGTYNIEVEANDKKLVSKSFEVKEYVLSTFDVNVYPTTVPLEEHQALNLTIEASYYFNKPVIGTVKMQLIGENVVFEKKPSTHPSIRQWDVNGMLQVSIPYVTVPNDVEDKRNINLNITFTEQYTNRTVTKEQQITVYKHKYKVTLEEKNLEFHPVAPYKGTLIITTQDGIPASGVAVQVQVDGLDNNLVLNSTSDKKGFIGLHFDPSASTETVNVTVSIGNERLLFETIEKVKHLVNGNIEIELKSPAQLNKMLKAVVKCSTRGGFFAYFVVAKGNIVESGSYSLGQVTRHSIQLNVTEPMVPKFKIIVASLSNNIIVYDYVDVVVKEFLNNFDIRIVADKSDTFRPDNQIEFNLMGRPKAYVALASYDMSVLQHGSSHDIGLDDIWRIFEGFHTPELNKYDVFQSMGLFVRTLNELQHERAPLRSSGRTVPQGGNIESQRLVAYRTDFPESWLWKTIFLPNSGRTTIIEQLPDTTTSWYLTGFSVDPMYGFGIIKKPLQFTTDQPFYIVDNLPYSVKRGEAVLLQFTLFNTLGAEYIADVTMFNVASQIEFVGQPKVKSFKKSLNVPPNVGVPVAFLVKPKKLGDMVVRLEASIMLGMEKDALERIVRVLPESLVHTRMISNLVAHKTYANESIDIPLEFGGEPELDSIAIDFSVTPSVLTNVIENLGKLLEVPTGCGEQNMIRFVPNVVVLDYMQAISSTEYGIMEKAKRYLQTGYQNQMRYRKPNGSFGVWKHGGGSVFLTAFVGKSMKTAAKYIYVSDYQMSTAYDWLAKNQKPNGRFDEIGPVFHTDMQGGLRQGLALTSYVMIAFLEYPQQATRHPTVVQRGMQYIANNIFNTNDVYDLAIATYALWLNKHHEKSRAIDRLTELSTKLQNGQQLFWSRQSNQIETTAYALLAYVEAGKYPEGVAIMRWLVKQRYATGSFPRTQDTFVALKALTKLAEKIFPKSNNYVIKLEHAQERKEFTVNSANISFVSAERLPNTIKDLKVTFTGTGTALVQVAYQYSTNVLQSSNRFNIAVTRMDTTSSFVLKLHICSSFEPAWPGEHSNMALVEVNLPSGYVVDTNCISQATTVNPIREKEILYGATSVVLYYDNMGNERNCFVITAYRRFKVALRRPAYVKVHDYYNPNFFAITAYEVDQQELCDLCDSDECISTCPRGAGRPHV